MEDVEADACQGSGRQHRWRRDIEPVGRLRRGQRAGHVREGVTGTWEPPSTPPMRRYGRAKETERGQRSAGCRSVALYRRSWGTKPKGPSGGKAAPSCGTDRRTDGRDIE